MENPQLGRVCDKNLRLSGKRRADLSGKRGQIIKGVHVALPLVASFSPVRELAPIRVAAAFPCDSAFVPVPGALFDWATAREHLVFPFLIFLFRFLLILLLLLFKNPKHLRLGLRGRARGRVLAAGKVDLIG
jgi:hypothetical protein